MPGPSTFPGGAAGVRRAVRNGESCGRRGREPGGAYPLSFAPTSVEDGIASSPPMKRSPLQPHVCSKCLKVGVTTKAGLYRSRTVTEQEPEPVERTEIPPVEQVQGLAPASGAHGPASTVQLPTASIAATSARRSGGTEMSRTDEYAHPMLQFLVQAAPAPTATPREIVRRIASGRI